MIPGDTIVAAATPFGYSGVALVRISGPDALVYAKRATGLRDPVERRATVSYTHLPLPTILLV